jgi:hypothetical protein
VPPLRPRIGIEQENARENAPAGAAAITAVASSTQTRMFSIPSASMRASSFATPLINGSQPTKPTSGFSSARAQRCSPPPKPISSQTSRPANKRPARSVSRSISSRGSKSRISPDWCALKVLPFARP